MSQPKPSQTDPQADPPANAAKPKPKPKPTAAGSYLLTPAEIEELRETQRRWQKQMKGRFLHLKPKPPTEKPPQD